MLDGDAACRLRDTIIDALDNDDVRSGVDYADIAAHTEKVGPNEGEVREVTLLIINGGLPIDDEDGVGFGLSALCEGERE